MSKNLLSSLRRGVNLNRKTASAIFSTLNPKARNPKTPYVIGVTNTFCKELLSVAVTQLRKAGIVPANAMVTTPAQLAMFLTDEQCALIQGFISPRPKNRATGYPFENAEITFVVARKGDNDLENGDVKMTHEIADLLNLPVEQILISKVGAVDPDSTPAVIIQEADPFGGAYAGMLPNSADQNDDADLDLGDDNTVELYTQAEVDALKGDALKDALKAAAVPLIKGADGKTDVLATKAQLVGKAKAQDVPF